MATKSEHTQMAKFIDSLLGDDANLLTVSEPKSDLAYHISGNAKIPAFIPAVTNRTIEKEDRRVPRICVAESLWNCLLGYAATVDEFYSLTPGDWRGGYYIYAIPCKLLVTADKKILPDVKKTDERWILGFDDAHKSIPADVIGKCFFYSVTLSRAASSPMYDIQAYIELKQPMPILPNVAEDAAAGYYKLIVTGITDTVFWATKNATLETITREEFMSSKRLAAGTLSFDTQSATFKW